MAQNPRTGTDASPPTKRNKRDVSRRSFVRSVAVAATALTGTATLGTAAAAEYDTVTISANESHTVTVESGDTLENVLFDCTADGAHVTIAAQGTDWTVRNVGVEGRVGRDEAVLGVADTGGNTSTIENVYVGDGAESGHRVGLGIWVAPDHSGHLDIDRVNIQEMGDNSFYCSAPGSGAGGTVDIRNCYSANSWVSNFRLAEGTVENCTAVNDERHKDGRGIWAWGPGPVEVVDSNLQMNGRHYSIVAGANGKGTSVEVSGTNYGTDYHGGIKETDGSTIDLADGTGTSPEDVLPEGCPSSPDQAASGTAD